MATKPDPVNDLPPAWGGAGNYSAGVYSPLLPWGDANPLAGQPLPWGAQPRLNSTNLTSFANAGHTPQVPDNASQYNEWLRRLQVWVPWIISGSDVDGADAHIVETDAGGIINVQAVRSTTGYVGLGNIPARLPVGANVASPASITLEGDANIVGTNTSDITVGAVNFLGGGPPLGATSIGVSAGGELFYTTALRVHASANGYVYATGDQEPDTGNAAVQQICETTVAVTAAGAGNVKVIVEGQVQVSALPTTITINVQENQSAAPAWTNIGAAQVKTATHDNSDANGWQDFRHERTYAAGVVASSKYRVEITSGVLVRAKESYLRVVNERD